MGRNDAASQRGGCSATTTIGTKVHCIANLAWQNPKTPFAGASQQKYVDNLSINLTKFLLDLP
jgi:hypothetical protein